MEERNIAKRPRRAEVALTSAHDNAAEEAPQTADLSAWQTFLSRYPKRASEFGDAIYAIPDGLIDAVLQDVPGVLRPEDVQFERDLTRLSGIGFVFGRPIVFPALEQAQRSSVLEDPNTSTDRLDRTSAAIIELLDEEKQRSGLSTSQIKELKTRAEQHKRIVAERQLAYAGWLVTNSAFRLEREAIKKKWDRRIRREQRFPSLPISYFGESLPQVPKPDRPYYNDYKSFYRRWSIDALAGWGMPRPMHFVIDTPNIHPNVGVDDAGIVVFIPWYLLRHKDIKLQELVDHHVVPPEMKAWVDGKKEEVGTTRFALMFELYCYLELAIGRRYRQRLHRKAEALDRALSRYFQSRDGKLGTPDRMCETLKKIRSEMSRRLAQ